VPAPAVRSSSAAWSGVAAALAATVLFGVNGTVSKVVLDSGLSSARLVETRSAGSALCLLLFLALTRPAALRARPGELAFLAVAGVVGIGLVQWFYLVAIHRLDVGIALLLEYLAPVFVALWVRFVGRGEVRARVWWALLLSVGGLVVVAQVWHGLTLDGLGVVAAVAAAVALAAYYLTGEHALAGRDPLSLAAWTFTAAALLWSVAQPWWSFPAQVLDDRVALPGSLDGMHAPLWLLVAWVVVLGTVVPYALVLVALSRLGSTRTGLVCMAEPVFASVVAWSVLAESLTVAQIIGGVVVLSGIVLAETSRPDASGPAPFEV
jgi:drug/metabolite transporter (DMT)-like permease